VACAAVDLLHVGELDVVVEARSGQQHLQPATVERGSARTRQHVRLRQHVGAPAGNEQVRNALVEKGRQPDAVNPLARGGPFRIAVPGA